jgi:putative hemolysin
VTEIEEFMIPVPFPHEEDAREQSLEMRSRAMAHLKQGGVIALFPSGVVASSDSFFGPAIERTWNPFTANLIQRSGATVVPIFFPGQNSRAYQIATQISATLRQGLLLHEVIHACGKPQAPIVGEPIYPEAIEAFAGRSRDFVASLRDTTIGLGKKD